jgi:2-keto-3-deoxy-6-phosphogluconate aldolase
MPTRGYLSQSELPVTIGLGTAAKPDAVEITWPAGGTQQVSPQVDELTVVTEAR